MEIFSDIHSKVVHFPIAFLMLYPVIELIFIFFRKDFFSKTAFLFLSVGVLGALFAVLSGNLVYQHITNWTAEAKDIFFTHQLYANLTVWFYAILLAVRYFLFIKKKLNRTVIIIIFAVSLIGGYFVYQTGNYGGRLAEQIIILTNSTNTK